MTTLQKPEQPTPVKSNRERFKKVIQLAIAPHHFARTRFAPATPDQRKSISKEDAILLLERQLPAKEQDSLLILLAGPGDPLATASMTIDCAQEIHKRYPQVAIGLQTLGIGASTHAAALAKAGVKFVEIHVNGVRKEVVEKLYAWIRPGQKTMKLSEAAPLLLEEQRSGVSALAFHTISVSILTTLYPGYNLDHITKISSEMVELGAESIALQPHSGEVETEVQLRPPSCEESQLASSKAGRHLPVVEPLMKCTPEAEAVNDGETLALLGPSPDKPNIAVASSNGMDVDLHLGQAVQFLIYGPRDDGLNCLLETREAPEPGMGSNRWLAVANILKDCSILLTASAGEKPRKILSGEGLRVHITEAQIESIVDSLYGGGKRKKGKNR